MFTAIAFLIVFAGGFSLGFGCGLEDRSRHLATRRTLFRAYCPRCGWWSITNYRSTATCPDCNTTLRFTPHERESE